MEEKALLKFSIGAKTRGYVLTGNETLGNPVLYVDTCYLCAKRTGI